MTLGFTARKKKRSRYPLRYTLLESSRYINTLHGAKPYIYGKRRTNKCPLPLPAKSLLLSNQICNALQRWGIYLEKQKPLPDICPVGAFRLCISLNNYPFIISIGVFNLEKSLSSVTSLKEETLHNSA